MQGCICEEDYKDPGQYEVDNVSFFTSADIEKKIRLTIDVVE